MDRILCMARAYGDEPVCRCVVGRHRNLIYLVHPSLFDSGGIRGQAGVGFPREHVFKFDKALFDGLSLAYQRGESSKLGLLWGQAEQLEILDIPKSA